MLEFIRKLLQPLNLPGFLTFAAVALSMQFDGGRGSTALWWAMAGFLLAFVAISFVPKAPSTPWTATVFVLEALCALAVVAISPRGGAAPALLVITVAQLAMVYAARTTAIAAIVLNLALFAILYRATPEYALVNVLIFMGFQAFSALIAHYARTAERARDLLALVNADLLATRALLADSARDAERLRVARELHDVAGHKLTAMTLNLRVLAADPAFAQRPEIALAQQLSSELLGDLRNVVQALRDARGLDLGTALHALAAPLPKPLLRLEIDDDVQVTDPAIAEAILRLVQEALTNSARHADAGIVTVAIRCEDAQLRIGIEDDGRLRGPLREGNGLAGMRERVAALGGTLALCAGTRGALRIDVALPA